MLTKSSKIIPLVLCFLLIFEQSGFAQVTGQLDLSVYISGLRSTLTTDKYRPLHLRYLGYDAKSNDFKLLLDKGDYFSSRVSEFSSSRVKSTNPRTHEPENSTAHEPANTRTHELKQETNKLMEYFFIGLTLPNESFWVNLRPDSPDNIIDSALAKTDIGKILLEADVQLKKDTALYTSPQTAEGKKYWDKLYKKAEELYGCDNITIPTLTRPWIVPGEIIIRETPDNAYIYKATLKVMLEDDYLSSRVREFVSSREPADPRTRELNKYSTQLIKELIIPKLTKEINTSKRYAALRQVYYSLILAQWFKQRFNCRGGSPYPPVNKRLPEDIKTNNHNGTAQRPSPADIINSGNLYGLTSKIPWSKDTYYKEYQKSFKDGEYNLKEPVHTVYGQTIRSYFSGGMSLAIQMPLTGVSSGVVHSIKGNSDRDISLIFQKNTAVFSRFDRENNIAIGPYKIVLPPALRPGHDVVALLSTSTNDMQIPMVVPSFLGNTNEKTNEHKEGVSSALSIFNFRKEKAKKLLHASMIRELINTIFRYGIVNAQKRQELDINVIRGQDRKLKASIVNTEVSVIVEEIASVDNYKDEFYTYNTYEGYLENKVYRLLHGAGFGRSAVEILAERDFSDITKELRQNNRKIIEERLKSGMLVLFATDEKKADFLGV